MKIPVQRDSCDCRSHHSEHCAAWKTATLQSPKYHLRGHNTGQWQLMTAIKIAELLWFDQWPIHSVRGYFSKIWENHCISFTDIPQVEEDTLSYTFATVGSLMCFCFCFSLLVLLIACTLQSERRGRWRILWYFWRYQEMLCISWMQTLILLSNSYTGTDLLSAIVFLNPRYGKFKFFKLTLCFVLIFLDTAP